MSDDIAKSLCWFPWYPKDWLTSDAVGRMNDAQIAAYVFLLNRQWLCKDCLLPDDMEILSKYSMHDMNDPKMGLVLEQFPVVPEGGRANAKLYDIYLSQHEKYKKRANSARKRWEKIDVNANDDAMHDAMHTAMHEHTQSGSGSGSVSISPSPEGECEREPKPRPRTFKQWTRDELLADVVRNNSDELLTVEEAKDFADYWMEPSASGKSRMSLEKTWDTRRRMHTALRMVYGSRRSMGPAGVVDNKQGQGAVSISPYQKRRVLDDLEKELEGLRGRRWDEDARMTYPKKWERYQELKKKVAEMKAELEREVAG